MDKEIVPKELAIKLKEVAQEMGIEIGSLYWKISQQQLLWSIQETVEITAEDHPNWTKEDIDNIIDETYDYYTYNIDEINEVVDNTIARMGFEEEEEEDK